MNWNDYEAVWKRQALPLGAEADMAHLLATFETRSRKLHAVVMVRDLAEAGAGILVACANAATWWHIGRAGWPMAIAMALILGVSAVFLGERLRARRARLGPDAPLIAKVDSDIRLLRRQCRLLRSVWAWYLAPCAAAIAIQVGVVVRRLPRWDPVREPAYLLGFFILFALVFGFAWAINRRALRKRLLPRLEELEKMRREILGDP